MVIDGRFCIKLGAVVGFGPVAAGTCCVEVVNRAFAPAGTLVIDCCLKLCLLYCKPCSCSGINSLCPGSPAAHPS